MPNNKMKINTNNIVGSIKTVEHKIIKFNELWDAYPSSVDHKDPKTGDEIFLDKCAIKVSQALYANGVLMESFKGTRCWQCPTPTAKRKGVHAIRAQELADYLNKKPFAGCPTPVEMSGSGFENAISGKKGIVFFQNYWQREGEKYRTGDHIDLWNSNRLASVGYFRTRGRLLFPYISEEVFDVSDLRKSSKVIFWEMSE